MLLLSRSPLIKKIPKHKEEEERGGEENEGDFNIVIRSKYYV